MRQQNLTPKWISPCISQFLASGCQWLIGKREKKQNNSSALNRWLHIWIILAPQLENCRNIQWTIVAYIKYDSAIVELEYYTCKFNFKGKRRSFSLWKNKAWYWKLMLTQQWSCLRDPWRPCPCSAYLFAKFVHNIHVNGLSLNLKQLLVSTKSINHWQEMDAGFLIVNH